MPDKITMDKRRHLGYGEVNGMVKIGRKCGYDVYLDDSDSSSYVEVWLYDPQKIKKMRSAFDSRKVERMKIAAHVDLSKRKKFWHVDLAEVDSQYRGKKLARKMYSFLIKKGFNLQAGDCQSVGGRYVWNELAKDRSITIFARKSPYSKIIDYPRPGEKELKSKSFDLFDSKAVIYAVAN